MCIMYQHFELTVITKMQTILIIINSKLSTIENNITTNI